MKVHPFEHQRQNLRDFVATIPFFQAQSDELIGEMLPHTTIVDCDPGDVIIEEGNQGRSMIFLLRGQVRIEREGAILGATETEGEMLGELALLRDGRRTASIVAATQVFCLRTDYGFIDHLSESQAHEFWAAAYKYLAITLAQRVDEMSLKLARSEQMLAERS